MCILFQGVSRFFHLPFGGHCITRLKGVSGRGGRCLLMAWCRPETWPPATSPLTSCAWGKVPNGRKEVLKMARNGNTMNAGISREMRKAVYKRDGYRCAVCDATEGLQIHHIKPRGKGGANHPMNLVTLCWRCHAAVHGSIMGDEYAAAAGCEKGMTPEDVRREVMFYMELEITRYVSDYYAEQGKIWYPWDG